MLPPPAPVRLALPPGPEPPARRGIPIVATLAPVALSLAVWALTQSVLSLLFAGLGPVVAVAGAADAWRGRRRDRRRAIERLRASLVRLRERIEEEHERERRRLDLLAPPATAAALARWAAERWTRAPGPESRDEAVPVRIGTGQAASPVRLDGDDDGPAGYPGEADALVEGVRAAAAAVPEAPIVADARDGVGVVGPLPLARAAARVVAIEAAASLPPGRVAMEAPGADAERWTRALPHAVRPGPDGCLRFADGDGRGVLIAWARDEGDLPPGCRTILRPGIGVRARALTGADAVARAAELARAAERHGLAAETRDLPDRVELGELLAAAPEPRRGSLAAPIGHDGRDPVVVDLVADGPHALIGGTTGSGKSELLVAWVLAMAHGRSPDEVTFLLVDFKGGAAFAPLAEWPHVVGILSDLDARLTRRAIESLRAELLRRERLLADAGVRAIDDLPPGALARLVVVVDEFAAVVAGVPELHEVFADLAARGRSLGLHLVLCTQRPAGVVRDGVLANVTLRIGLRMTDRGDSVALLGDDGAARLPAEPRGRAVRTGDAGTTALQIAIAGPAELARGRAAAPGAATRPWLDPLPEVLPRAALGPATADEIPFGLVDLPAEQRQPAAVHVPARHGHLLVVGAPASGRTTALAVLAAAPHARVLPAHPADAWHVVAGLLDGPRRTVLLIADDLDLLLGRVDPERRHDVAELLARLLREGPARGVHVVASALRVAGALQALAGLFASRLVLRMPSREEHVLAGGGGAEFDPGLPPGAGRWRGAAVQVAWPGADAAALAAETPELRTVAVPSAEGPLAIVAARPAPILARLRDAGIRVQVLGEQLGDDAAGGDGRAGGDGSAGSDGRAGSGDGTAGGDGAAAGASVILGDPDAWQAEWALLARVRRELPMALVGCTPGELRALTRRPDAPPLGDRPDECWLADGGGLCRAVLVVDERFRSSGAPRPRNS